MTTARDDILARIRATERTPLPFVRAYRRTGARSLEERVALFCERVSDYRAEIRRTTDVAAEAAELGGRLLVPAGLPNAWRSPNTVEDRGLTPRELDAVDGVLSGCTVAIAETGTIVLSAGPAEGRRALTLVPDLHLCVVRESQIVETVPEAFARLEASRPITFISGPSATSDIELSRVEGVHGPRTLIVLVVPGEAS